MSDLSAGQPVAEPVGPPPGSAPTDAPDPADASGGKPSPAPRPRAVRSTVTEAPPGSSDPSGDAPPSDPTADREARTAGVADEATDGSPSNDGGAGSGPNPRRRRRRPATGSSADRPAPDRPTSDGPESDGPASGGRGSGGPGTARGASNGPGPEGSVQGDLFPVPAAHDDGVSSGAERPPARPVAERPRIGDTRPAPAAATPPVPVAAAPRSPRRGSAGAKASGAAREATGLDSARPERTPATKAAAPPDDQDEDGTKTAGGRSRRRSGRERRGRPVGRYLMCVHVRPHATQIAVLEGRTLVEHQVSRAADDATQIDGNIYRGRVQNVLPGMEAAFVDIGTPKNAVLYRGDVRYDRDDIETSGSSGGGGGGGGPRIEQMLRAGQTILCQVTKNPIGAKGARLTQEVSLPGRFVVMVPNSSAFGISKRLDDAERKLLRRIVDDVRPKGHGLIVRTAAEGASQEELGHDVERLAAQWAAIEAEAGRSTAPGLLYREPDLAVRSVREEFNREYRGVVIDDEDLFNEVRDYIEHVNPELADRVELYDPVAENMPVFERFHVHEQLHKALDRKVWLPSGGSLIIERTEALTVIDVNTGKNVGTSNLEETVYRNNLEAAEEIARQLRLRDIGGIIVIDFIDMEIRENRDKVASALRSALARDKTRTQVFDISELGLIEMTRKRVSEGLVESLSSTCAICGGRGIVLDETLL
jgi:ribonuclease E